MEHGEKDDGGARLCGGCVGHRFYSLCMEVPQEVFKQDRDTIQFMFLRGKSIPIQTLPLGNVKSRQKEVPSL